MKSEWSGVKERCFASYVLLVYFLLNKEKCFASYVLLVYFLLNKEKCFASNVLLVYFLLNKKGNCFASYLLLVYLLLAITTIDTYYGQSPYWSIRNSHRKRGNL